MCIVSHMTFAKVNAGYRGVHYGVHYKQLQLNSRSYCTTHAPKLGHSDFVNVDEIFVLPSGEMLYSVIYDSLCFKLCTHEMNIVVDLSSGLLPDYEMLYKSGKYADISIHVGRGPNDKTFLA